MSISENRDIKSPTGLFCEYTKNPLGIDVTRPRFSWVPQHTGRGQRQSAYQVLVASSRESLNSENADMWDSGKVESEKSVNVVYNGKNLESGRTYYWKVRFWDKDGQISSYSQVASFEMGLLKEEKWKARWITGGGLLRKEFSCNKKIKKARAYICGLGYYELRVNGEKVGDHVLDPGWTDYDKRCLYVTYDITEHLREGNNAVGVMLGNGRYSPPEQTLQKNLRLKKYGDSPVLLCQIKVEFTNGECMEVITDNTWKVAQGPILKDDIYDGEVYDARQERPGWDIPSYNDSEWDAARIVDAPGGELVSQATFPPIKVIKKLQPERILNPKPGVYVYDFGQNFTGWVKLRVEGPGGAKVTLRYAELLDNNGMINTIPNRDAEATDVYILKGEGEEVYEPRFTYHGFRYVEMRGFPGTPSPGTIEGCVVHSAVNPVGGFSCSNHLINRIHHNVLWGQLSNLMSIPTDCPQRDERMGWMGDAQLTVEEAIYNFQMAGFYTKWVQDIKDSQGKDGAVPDVVPPYWRFYPADPAWGTAWISIPWYLYLYYEDKRILQENYSGMKAWVDFLTSQAKDHLLLYGKYGDWCPPQHVRSPDTPLKLTSTFYYYHDSLLLSRIARILGKEEDAAKYSRLCDKIKDAFNREFLQENHYSGVKYSDIQETVEELIPPSLSDEEKEKMREHTTSVFVPTSQTAQILPLFLDMVPEEKKDTVLESLIRDIELTRSAHPNTGIVGTRYLFDVLTKYGYVELAYRMLTQTTFPSWGYMVQEGATTLWERWEYLAHGGMNSHNHIMLGAIDTFLYKVLAGITLSPSSPGFKHILIKPYPVGDLKHASGSVDTIRGRVSSSWSRNDTSFTLEVSIPVNARATVSIPKMQLEKIVVEEKGKVIWKEDSFVERVAGITKGREDGDYITFEVGSGEYVFQMSGE